MSELLIKASVNVALIAWTIALVLTWTWALALAPFSPTDSEDVL